MKTRKRIPIGILVRGGGGFDSLSRQLEGKIAINIISRQRGGGFDSLSRQPEGKIAINIVVRGGGRFDPS